MKQLILTLMVALMSVMASTPAAAKSSKSELKKSERPLQRKAARVN